MELVWHFANITFLPMLFTGTFSLSNVDYHFGIFKSPNYALCCLYRVIWENELTNNCHVLQSALYGLWRFQVRIEHWSGSNDHFVHFFFSFLFDNCSVVVLIEMVMNLWFNSVVSIFIFGWTKGKISYIIWFSLK